MELLLLLNNIIIYIGIIHRDLKLENILVATDPLTKMVKYVKIIDFGFAKFVNKHH
jgi:serine/threonine protein kinase